MSSSTKLSGHTALVFSKDDWDYAKERRSDISVGDMERLEPHATQLSHLLIFEVDVWEELKASRSDLAPGDMERLEEIANLR